jgi:hypothetical protein
MVAHGREMGLLKSFLVLLLLGLLPQKSLAEDAPVVVELFTSQGCSSCPPADELLREMSERPDVIALAFHVDYWDYIGWKDTFGNPEFTLRQKGYAHAQSARTIYTPQFMIAGHTAVGGAHPQEIDALITEEAARAEDLHIQVVLADEGRIRISASPLVRLQGPVQINLVRYLPSAEVSITRGENKGRKIDYANVVTSWQILGTWSGMGDLTVEAPYSGDERGIVILQAADFGPILAAARID